MLVHVEGEPAVGANVCPEQRREPAAVLVGEPRRPGRVGQHPLHEQGVEVHQGRLNQVESEHGDLLVFPIGPGQLGLLAVEQGRIGAVPVLDNLEALVDLGAEVR